MAPNIEMQLSLEDWNHTKMDSIILYDSTNDDRLN